MSSSSSGSKAFHDRAMSSLGSLSLAMIIFMLGTTGLLMFSYLAGNIESYPDGHVIVFDAGSTHTEMSLFTFPFRGEEKEEEVGGRVEGENQSGIKKVHNNNGMNKGTDNNNNINQEEEGKKKKKKTFHHSFKSFKNWIMDRKKGHGSHKEKKSNGIPGTSLIDTSSVKTCKDKSFKGIASYADNPEMAAQSLGKCLRMALDEIPASLRNRTRVYLGGTAGMRDLKERNPAAAAGILKAIREYLIRGGPLNDTAEAVKGSFFHFEQEQVQILTGNEEGAYGWAAANYLEGNLKRKPLQASQRWAQKSKRGYNTPDGDMNSSDGWQRGIGAQRRIKATPGANAMSAKTTATVGALDLGGASTQITFVPAQADLPLPDGYGFAYTSLFSAKYTLYTHSYTHYGITAASKKLLLQLYAEQKPLSGGTLKNPCLHKGYSEPMSKTFPGNSTVQGWNITVMGGSSPDECAKRLRLQLNTSVPCPYESCSFDGVYQPPHGLDTMPITAFSAFAYPVDFLNASATHTTPRHLRELADHHCSRDWDAVKVMPASSIPMLPMYCFEAQYGYQLVVNGYKLGRDNSNITYPMDINGTVPSWPLGLALDRSSRVPAEDRWGPPLGADAPIVERVIHRKTYVLMSVVSLVLVCLSFVMLGMVIFRRRRNRSMIGGGSRRPTSSEYVPIGPTHSRSSVFRTGGSTGMADSSQAGGEYFDERSVSETTALLSGRQQDAQGDTPASTSVAEYQPPKRVRLSTVTDPKGNEK